MSHIFIKFLVLVSFGYNHGTLSCSSNSSHLDKHLGTRTPYRLITDNNFAEVKYDGCKADKIWMLLRHGTRNPSAGFIGKLNDRLPDIRDSIIDKYDEDGATNGPISNRNLDLFRNWKSKTKTKDEKKLAPEGGNEMIEIAERMQSKFPDILDRVYSNTTYRFKYTFSQRTRKSALKFATGLFGKQTAKDVWFPEPDKKDPILRFYKNCKKWDKDVKKNPASSKEVAAFENSETMKNMIKDVNKRLDLNEDLSLEDVRIMYSACGFETAWHKQKKSPWCSVFTEDNFKVLEYDEDLKFFYQDGYGFEITYKQACPAFGDMINFLEPKSRTTKATLYFTHSGTILKVLAHLGLYKDKEPLTSRNYEQIKDSYLFRTSKIDAFASNIAFVSFNCGSEKKILTMHQEKVVRLPACLDSDLCAINKINDYYSSSINSCDIAAICEN